MSHFQFKDLEIWQNAIELNDIIYDLAFRIEISKHQRMAEQLRAASLSISTNIAQATTCLTSEESGKMMKKADRGVYETITIIEVAHRRGFLKENELAKLTLQLETLSDAIVDTQIDMYKR